MNGPYLLRVEFPSPKDALCHVWLKLVQWFWRRIFLDFCISLLSPLWKRTWPYIYINLDSLHSRMFVPSLVENGKWFWRKQIFKLRQSTMNVRNFITICIFHNICPEKRRSPSFQTQLNLFHPRVFLCQVWLKIGPVVLKKKIFKFVNVFLLFRFYLSWKIS